ncbi:uncharacterized protein LOC108002556, partial [Apis cerana]|uniref:uncharacterized protein LOC108002556 n=1 Tax=Apis cerana TaxID=7461 RepID=UPI002B22B341
FDFSVVLLKGLHAMGSTTLVVRVPPRGTCYIDLCMDARVNLWKIFLPLVRFPSGDGYVSLPNKLRLASNGISLQTRREIFSSSRNNSWGPNYQSSCCVESAQTGVSSRLLLRRLPTLPTHARAICVCQLSFARSRHHQYIYRVFG